MVAKDPRDTQIMQLTVVAEALEQERQEGLQRRMQAIRDRHIIEDLKRQVEARDKKIAELEEHLKAARSLIPTPSEVKEAEASPSPSNGHAHTN